jgi:hypothetical protein
MLSAKLIYDINNLQKRDKLIQFVIIMWQIQDREGGGGGEREEQINRTSPDLRITKKLEKESQTPYIAKRNKTPKFNLGTYQLKARAHR